MKIIQFWLIFQNLIKKFRLKASHKASAKQQEDTIQQLRDQLAKKKDELAEALDNQGQVVEVHESKSSSSSGCRKSPLKFFKIHQFNVQKYLFKPIEIVPIWTIFWFSKLNKKISKNRLNWPKISKIWKCCLRWKEQERHHVLRRGWWSRSGWWFCFADLDDFFLTQLLKKQNNIDH